MNPLIPNAQERPSQPFTFYQPSLTTCLNVRTLVWPNIISNWPHAHNWPTFCQSHFPQCLTIKSNRALMERAQVTVAFFHTVYGATSTVDCYAWRHKIIYVRNTCGCIHSNVLSKSIRRTDKIINKAAFLALSRLGKKILILNWDNLIVGINPL